VYLTGFTCVAKYICASAIFELSAMQVPIHLSVVIPTRNEISSIRGAIAQYVPFFHKYGVEVIVSDAFSTDGTAEIVRSYEEKYPGHVRLVQALGKQNIAIGRNYGAQHARGVLLFHTDADVRIPNPGHFIREIIKWFEDSQRVAATTPIYVYPAERTFTDRAYHWLMNTTIRLSIYVNLCLGKGECQLVRRHAFEQIGGYNEELVAGEDCNLFYRLQQLGRVRFISRLEVHHSPRRFRQYGYWKVSYHYLLEGIWRLVLGKSFAEEWKVVR
jgi:glycosyltransferase involved in cell wall biosynthesis